MMLILIFFILVLWIYVKKSESKHTRYDYVIDIRPHNEFVCNKLMIPNQYHIPELDLYPWLINNYNLKNDDNILVIKNESQEIENILKDNGFKSFNVVTYRVAAKNI